MNLDATNLQSYVVIGAILAFIVWKFGQFFLVRRKLPGLISSGAQIVDVREKAEFSSGANPESKNIPLGQIKGRLQELDKTRPVILCCASGTRSGMAKSVLIKNGFKEVYNAGPWKNTLI